MSTSTSQAAAVLDVPPEASPEVARAAFLRQLADTRFVPPEDRVVAVNRTSGSALPYSHAADALAISMFRDESILSRWRAQLLAFVGCVIATLPVWAGSSTSLTVDGNTTFGASLTPAQLGFSDPNQCGLTALAWTGACGTSPGATLTCPFGTTAVTVAATNNSVGFGASKDLKVTVTDYALTVSPAAATVGAGKSATTLVTVSGVGGAFNSEVALSCANGNLPPQTTCTFDPPTVTPRGGTVQSRLTIATTASAFVPPATVRSWPPAPRVQVPRLRVTPATIVWGAFIALAWLGVRRVSPRRSTAAIAGLVVIAWLDLPVSVGRGATADSLSASAMASGIAVFPAGLTFGTQTIATTAPTQFVFVTNIGVDPLTLTSITMAGDFTQVNNCTGTVASGASCAIAVSFTPTVTASRTGSLSIVDDASGSPHVVSLVGTGQAAPATTGGTPTGSYAITVGGNSGALTHSGTVTLTVQ